MRFARARTRALDELACGPLGDVELASLEGERGHAELRALGWALGVLSAAAGGDALRGRRERRGLAVLVGLLEETLAPCRLRPDSGRLPHVACRGAGWEAAFLVASLFLAAAPGAVGGTLTWRQGRAGDGGAWIALGAGDAAPEVVRTVRPLLSCVPGAALEARGGRVRLALPAGWVELSARRA